MKYIGEEVRGILRVGGWTFGGYMMRYDDIVDLWRNYQSKRFFLASG